jgi:hypothetical protein
MMAADPEYIGIEADVLVDREILIQSEALRHIADLELHLFGILDHVASRDDDRAGVGPHDTRHHSKHGSLARAVGSDQAEDFSGLDRERQIVYREETVEALG